MTGILESAEIGRGVEIEAGATARAEARMASRTTSSRTSRVEPRAPGSLLHPTDGPDTLEVVRCRGYEPGASEPASKDGSSQLRLPFGPWIVDLRPLYASGA